MKKIIFIFLLTSIFSCKEKTDKNDPNQTAAASTNANDHFHYYRIYSGLFQTIAGNNENDEIHNCKFNDAEFKYYKNDVPTNSQGTQIWVYFLEDGLNKTIIAVNPKIDRYHKPRMSEPIAQEKTYGKGDYGCIPKFIAQSNGDLLFFTHGTQKYLNLNIAKHMEMNHQDSTVAVLRLEEFLIANSDYTRLNGNFINNKFLQGGISSHDLTEMKIYDEDDNYLYTVDNVETN
ncbi:MAG: hypothetical protein H7X99_04075 [Saprospiraceae bacterium]|nr:hypothetical protein [Saprospiraceae bacterium]